MERNLENLIRDYLESRGQGGDGHLRHVEASMRECEGKLRNPLSLAEAGVALETVLPRIKEIERERDWLAQELAKARRLVDDSHAVKDAASESARFVLGAGAAEERVDSREEAALEEGSRRDIGRPRPGRGGIDAHPSPKK